MPKSLLRWRVPLGFAFGIWYIVMARPASLPLFFLCLSLVAAGCSLRAWAAGHLHKGEFVATGGPYAYIRNPLYVGSFLIGMGFCVALWQWPIPIASFLLTAAFLLGFGVVYRAKALAEEKELAAHLGKAYTTYAGQVPPFLPVRGRVEGLGESPFTWSQYRKNREYECILGCLAILVILYVKWIYF